MRFNLPVCKKGAKVLCRRCIGGGICCSWSGYMWIDWGNLFVCVWGFVFVGQYVLNNRCWSILVNMCCSIRVIPYVLDNMRRPIRVAPYALSPYALSPYALSPFALSPYALSPYALSPYASSPFAYTHRVIPHARYVALTGLGLYLRFKIYKIH
jgi:hypothetical protein